MDKNFIIIVVFLSTCSHAQNSFPARNSDNTIKYLPKLYMDTIFLGDSKSARTDVTTVQNNVAEMQKKKGETLFEFVLNNIKTLKSMQQTPKDLLTTVCQLLDPEETGVKWGNSVFIGSSDGQSGQADARQKVMKSTEYLLHIATSLGIPSFTYISSAVAQLDVSGIMAGGKMEEEPMCFRIEPSTRHLARAMVDFLKAYGWRVVSLIISNNTPGYRSLMEELNKISVESMQSSTDPDIFRFEISQTFEFAGQQSSRDLSKCMQSDPCKDSYRNILENLLKGEDRIFLFHGSTEDLRIFAHTVFNVPVNKHLADIFGKEYLWIVSPAAMRPADSDLKEFNSHLGNIEVPGLFGFYYISNPKRAMRLSANFWFEAMIKYKNELRKKGLTDVEIIQKLHPDFRCNTTSKTPVFWKDGRHLFHLAKSTTICWMCENEDESEFIGFDSDGFLNSTAFEVVNSRAKTLVSTSGYREVNTYWYPVGKWTQSSRVNKENPSFLMKGVTWPGLANKPPIGRPKKFKLNVATLMEDPFVIYTNLEKDGTCDVNSLMCQIVSKNNSNGERKNLFDVQYEDKCCTGLTMDLLKELMKDLDFDVNLFEVQDQKWGGWTPTEGWNGLVRVLLDRKADMVVTSLKITPNRSEQIEFSVPFQRTGISILVSLREGAISPTAFLEPYNYSSWCVILVFSVHACGAALFLYEWLSPQGLDRGNVPPREHKFSLFRSLWLIWSMLFGAAVNADNPRGVASRFLANIWALFALVFLASYTAKLAAFMIAKEDYYDIKGINDWRLKRPWNHKPIFKFATVPSGATEENVKLNFPEMANYMRKYNKSNVDEGIKALKNREIDAFLYDAMVLQFRVGKDENCRLRTVGNWYAVTGYGVGFPKNSKWLPKIDLKILEYQKNGKLQRWKSFWLIGACKPSRELGNNNGTLGVKNFISAFILLIGGMLICCILLVMEHIFYRYMRPRLKAWDRYGCCGLVSISMGQLLSFEQSVNQTVDLIKHHKCKNPICETQVWKLRHELDVATRRVRKLENLVEMSGVRLPGELADSSYVQQETLLPPVTTRAILEAPAPCTSNNIPYKHNNSMQRVPSSSKSSMSNSRATTPLLNQENSHDKNAASKLQTLNNSRLQLEKSHRLQQRVPRNSRSESENKEILYRHPNIRNNSNNTLAPPTPAEQPQPVNSLTLTPSPMLHPDLPKYSYQQLDPALQELMEKESVL